MIVGVINLIFYPLAGVIVLVEVDVTVLTEILFRLFSQISLLQIYHGFHLHWLWHQSCACLRSHGIVQYV